jgi:hypothetical protein
MADLNATIRLLEQQRDELLDQVNAIIRAIAALKGTDGSTRRAVAPSDAPVPGAPQRRKARKKRQVTLTEEHKQKLLEGQRRAREARERAAGAAEPEGSAATVADMAPRLVKGPQHVS